VVELATGNTIVGRQAELRALGRLAAAAAAGRGGVGWIEGEPGIGKSTLLGAALTRAAGLGCAVYHGAASELMQPFPLRLMADCLGISARSADPAARHIAGLLRGEHTVPETVDPVLAAGERMLEMVDRGCAGGPVVLAVEDLQWADEPSLLVWNRLARATDQIPLLLLGAARPRPQRVKLDRLRELVTDRGGALLDLGPMSPDSVADLAGRIAGGPPGPRLRAALQRAGGNPLYVAELVEALARDGLLAVTGPQAELRDGGHASPASLHVAISSRLGFVPEPTRKTLRMAALLGTEFDAGELAIVTQRPVAELADVLADAVASRVLSGGGDRLRFRHELIHQVLLEETPAAIRRALHGEFARRLAGAGSGAEAVARHLMAVPDQAGEWALSWLATTPIATLYALPQVSAELLGRAVESVGEDDPHWEVLATRLTQVLSWLGRDEQASQMGMTIAQRTGNPALASRMRIHIIRAAGRRQRWAEALPFCARSPADDGLPPALRIRLGAWSAVALSSAGQAAEGAAMAQDALRRAAACPDALTTGYARHAAATCCAAASRAGHLQAALTALGTLRAPDPEALDLRMMLLAEHASQSVHLARREEAEEALAQGLLLADRAGTYQAAVTLTAAAEFCHRYGRWDDALAHLANIDQEFFGTEQISPYQGLAALIALHRGDRALADTHLRAAAAARLLPASLLTRAHAVRAEADGDQERALDLLSGLLSAEPGLRPHQRRDDLPGLVRLALAVGEDSTAKAAAELAEEDLAVDGAPSRVTAAAFCRAMVEDDAAALLAVATTYQEFGWRPAQAGALEEAAVRLAAAGEVPAARRALTGAVRILTGLGAVWDIRRADRRLRAYGVRRGPRSIHRRASTGWQALTPSEHRIAGLVARGMSNPDIAEELFLSRRTVQAHVSNILGKLDLHSRVEIARVAAQQQAPGRGVAS
jgi:DNA-binding NarL/FixJ family response regulator